MIRLILVLRKSIVSQILRNEYLQKQKKKFKGGNAIDRKLIHAQWVSDLSSVY